MRRIKLSRMFHPVGQGAFYTERFCTQDNDKEQINIVYDCGSTTSKEHVKTQIEKTFKSGENRENIDAVFISHLHEDHINGIPDLIEHCNVKKIFFPIISDDAKKLLKIRMIIDGASKFTRQFIDEPMKAIKELKGGDKIELIGVLEDEGSNLTDFGEDDDEDRNPTDSGEEVFGHGKEGVCHRTCNSGCNVSKGISRKLDFWRYIPYNFKQISRVENNSKEIIRKFIEYLKEGRITEAELEHFKEGGITEAELVYLKGGRITEVELEHLKGAGITEAELEYFIGVGITGAELIKIVETGNNPDKYQTNIADLKQIYKRFPGGLNSNSMTLYSGPKTFAEYSMASEFASVLNEFESELHKIRFLTRKNKGCYYVFGPWHYVSELRYKVESIYGKMNDLMEEVSERNLRPHFLLDDAIVEDYTDAENRKRFQKRDMLIGCLYTGDYDAKYKRSFDKLISKYEYCWPQLGVIQVPHHGSEHNFNEALIKRGLACVISAGTENGYNHPSEKVISGISKKKGECYIVTEKGGGLRFDISIRFCR